MADSKKYEDYGTPLLLQGGWERTGEGSAYIQYASTYNPNYDYRICTLDYIPLHHPAQIAITGIANKELEASVLVLRADNYIIASLGWQDNGTTFNIGSTYDKIGVMFRFKNGDTISPIEVTFDKVGGWVHSLRKLTTATEVVENPLYSDGTAITAYTIKGNTVQNGTPTPDNPIVPQGTGDRTGNLFDYVSYFQTIQPWSGTLAGNYFDYGILHLSPNTTYTFSTNFHTGISGLQQNVRDVPFIAVDSNTNPSTAIGGFGDDGSVSVTTLSDGIIRLFKRIQRGSLSTDLADLPTLSDFQNGKWIMCNVGSTPLPYEPYGIKIPISSGGVTTNIYLGSTQTVRQIKKLVLDGTENWVVSSYPNIFYTADFTDYLRELDTNLSLCSHYRTIKQVQGASFITDGVLSWYGRTNTSRLYIGDVRFSTAAELQTYLGQQYAAGTPIVVWYALATPETATVNEPLMKIGDYADTLSNATAIPTTEGANSISVDTTVQPSEFTATWTGWHDANVKEWDSSDWR